MEKHKKLEAGINHINHKELKKIKIIHLKTTPSKNGITHLNVIDFLKNENI